MSATSERLNSSKNQNWRTEKRELDLVRLLGPIVFDPMTDADNPTGAKFFCAPDGHNPGNGPCISPDVFALPAGCWAQCGGLVFINPTWGRSLKKCAKLIAEEGEAIGLYAAAELVCLAPHRLDTWWCRRLQRSADKVCVLPYRPFFHEQKPDGSWGRAQSKAKGKPGKWVDTAVTVPCALYYWGRRPGDVQAMWLSAVPEATFIKVV